MAEDSRRIGLCGLCSTLTRGRSPSTLREAVDRESRVAEEAQRERSTQLRLRRDVFD